MGHDGTAQELPCLNGQAQGGHTGILYHKAAGEDLNPEKQPAGVAADTLHCGLKIQISAVKIGLLGDKTHPAYVQKGAYLGLKGREHILPETGEAGAARAAGIHYQMDAGGQAHPVGRDPQIGGAGIDMGVAINKAGRHEEAAVAQTALLQAQASAALQVKQGRYKGTAGALKGLNWDGSHSCLTSGSEELQPHQKPL